MNTPSQKYGLIIEHPKAEDYVFGGGMIGTKEINPSGNWKDFLVSEELQNLQGCETMACTVFGTHNCLEILLNFLFREENNYSERFTAILSGVTPMGGSPQAAAETIRANGLIPEKMLPFSPDITKWADFYSPKPMSEAYLLEAKKWLQIYDFKHEYLWNGMPSIETRQKLISDALKRSPVGMAVYAWASDNNGIYQQIADPNHWVCCYGLDPSGNYLIFDSYDNTHKVYSKNADVPIAKMYWLDKQKPKPSFLDTLRLLLARLFN